MKVENADRKDCLPCRLISGTGIIGAGLYVAHQAKKQTPVAKVIMFSISTGFCTLGACRLLDLPPFQHVKSH